MSIRRYLNFSDDYWPYNREERNYAAIFYHVLQVNNNLPTFLSLTNTSHQPSFQEWSLYLEYAFLRDLWKRIDSIHKTTVARNEAKKGLILDSLQPMPFDGIDTVAGFNRYFGGRSKTDIESPSNWSMGRYHQTITDNTEFLKVSRFKWCFNAKPDIVLHLSKDKALCIEAKLESKIGEYPCTSTECNLFASRGMQGVRVSQMEIQRQIMELLGIEATFYLLQEKASASTNAYMVLTWKGIFESLNLDGIPTYMRGMIKARFGV